MSASEIPADTEARPPEPEAAISWKAVMMPSTVPRRPTNGADDATVASAAPFVGLLGTVLGIITAFQLMAASGSGGLASVSAGISEALITTAFGLLVAIPALMMFNYLTNRVEEMSVDIADASNELVDFFLKEGRFDEPLTNPGAKAPAPGAKA